MPSKLAIKVEEPNTQIVHRASHTTHCGSHTPHNNQVPMKFPARIFTNLKARTISKSEMHFSSEGKFLSAFIGLFSFAA